VKNLQYLMGHSDVAVPLNVYTHASYDRAAEQMIQLLDPDKTRNEYMQSRFG